MGSKTTKRVVSIAPTPQTLKGVARKIPALVGMDRVNAYVSLTTQREHPL